MIVIDKITKKYPSGEGCLYAINDLSIEIGENEFMSIIGKSGSGKSTLLNLIGSLDTVNLGKIVIDGKDISKLDNKGLANFRNRELGFIFQNYYLEQEYTVYDNIEIPLIISGSFGRNNSILIKEALAQVDLINKINSKVKTLSGGEQQRVAIARAIIKQPKYILADEPCGNLDVENSKNIMDILKKLHSSGKTILLVTHDEHDAKKAKRIITLSDGRIVKDEKNTLDY